MKEELNFIGLNKDDEDRALQKGDYRNGLNVRVGSDNDNIGALENVKGNTLITNSELGAGANTCVGTLEDKEGNSIIYFIKGTPDGIYRYNRSSGTVDVITQSSTLNFPNTSLGKNIKAELVNNDLLYWTNDSNPPRKISLSKAIEGLKARQWKLYFPNDAFDLDTYGVAGYFLQYRDSTGTIINNVVNITNSPTNPSDDGTTSSALKKMEYMITSNPHGVSNFINRYVTVEFCGDHLLFTAKNAGEFTLTMVAHSTHTFAIIPQNYYPSPFIEEYIDLIKYAPSCQPALTYMPDDEIETSLVKDKVFQARVRYIYDDKEKSALGPISTIPISLSNSDRYIKIDFTDDRLIDSLAIIKFVEVFIRERNSGDFRSVVVLSPADFIKDTTANPRQYYNFYNDGAYAAIDVALANKPYDAVPLLAKSQVFAEDRLILGGITEDRDPICIDAGLNVEYTESVDVGEKFNVSGNLYIRNIFLADSELALTQPIHDEDNGQGIVFGGFGSSLGGVTNNLKDDYYQDLPLGGFIVYLAGTDYWAKTKQVKGLAPTSIQGTNGVYNSSSTSNKKAIRKEMTGEGTSDPLFGPDKIFETRVWNTWEIKNVPAGRYVLRVASHHTTEAQLASQTREYQNFSTNVLMVGLSKPSTDPWFEKPLDLTKNISSIHISIADLTNPTIASSSTALVGYVTDEDIAAPSTVAQYLSDTRIERADVEISNLGTSYNAEVKDKFFPMQILSNPGGLGRAITDHNGYFYSGRTSAGNLDITDININGNLLGPVNKDINAAAAPFTGVSGSNAAEIICRNTNSDVSDSSRTRLIGKVQDSLGNGVEGANIVAAWGDVQKTDPQGAYEVIVYGNGANIYGDGMLNGNLAFSAPRNFIADYDQDLLFYEISMTVYNFTDTWNMVPSPITAILVGSNSSNSFFKRGFDGKFGLVYYDEANRNNAVTTTKELDLHIYFYSEPDPSIGRVHFTGIPGVSWRVMSLPPAWATHYQWVRTKNMQTNYYLQVAIKDIAYVDRDGNVGTFNNDKFAAIGIGFTEYSLDNPDSEIGYTFTEGDRMRFIESQTAYYSEYYDFEIKKLEVITGGTSGTKFWIDKDFTLGEIGAGYVVEIYTPKLQTEEDFYYEFGECYKIGNPGLSTRYHEGPTADQNPNDPIAIPARGTFNSGDAYYRQRTMAWGTGDRTFSIDDAAVSDFFPSTDDNIGRVNVIDKDEKQLERDTAIRFSNLFIQDTNVNGLSSFEALNEKTLSNHYGKINALVRASVDVLLALCANSYTISMYLNKQLFLDTAGSGVVALADEFIPQKTEMRESYGTSNSESVSQDDSGHVYFWDINNGTWVRYASNGLYPISSYKMGDYFKDKGKSIRGANLVQRNVISIFDRDFQELIVTYTASGRTDTVAFNNSINRWTSFYSFVPEFYGKLHDEIVSFENGELYLHNDNSTYNNFYGDQFVSKIRPVAKLNPSEVKTWLAIVLHSNSIWAAPNDSIIIPATGTYTSGMLSRLIKDKFVDKEGKYYTNFDQDMNTPNFATTTEALLNGRELKGQVLDIELENNETVLAVLYQVDIEAIISKRN